MLEPSKSVLAIVPARGGSKGIPRKNSALCAGKPLIQWTYDAIKESKLVTRAILSSEDAEILADAPSWIGKLERPMELAQDDSSTESVIEHVLQCSDGEIIVLLQPTSPIRTGQQIDEAILLATATAENGWYGYDSVVSVSPSHTFLWTETDSRVTASYDWRKRPRRQEMSQWQENGSIYVFTRNLWERTHNRLGGHIGLYKMGEAEGYQVDTPLDLFIVEQILLKRQREALVG